MSRVICVPLEGEESSLCLSSLQTFLFIPHQKRNTKKNKSDVNWNWERATDLQRDFAAPPMTFYFFLYAAKTQTDVSLLF